MSKRLSIALLLMSLGTAAPALAQDGVPLHRAVDAAILSDVARDRQAEREARRQPYAAPGYGPIASAAQASDACAETALYQAGSGARILGRPSARTMSTGWEVEGELAHAGESSPVPFVCSVRNGSVSGILLKPS